MECPVCSMDVNLESVLIIPNVAGMEVNFYCPGCDGWCMKILTPEEFEVIR